MVAARPKFFIILSYEALVFAGAFLLVRRAYAALVGAGSGLSARMLLILALFFAAYFYLMWRDLYSRNYHYYLRKTYRVVLKNATISILLVLAVTAVLSGIERSQLLPALLVYLPVGALSFFVVHGSHFLWIRYLSHIGYFRRNCLILGSPSLRFAPEASFQDIGNTKNYVGRIFRKAGKWEWLGSSGAGRYRVAGLRDVKRIILKENIGELICFLGDGLGEAALLELVAFCQTLSIGYYLVPDPSALPRGRRWSRLFPPIPALERFPGNRDSLTSISLKRLLDISVAIAALVLFLPLGLLIALAVKLEDGGPVFYTTTRIGKNGRPIRFYKFRSMVVDAERLKPALLRFNLRSDGPLFKMRNDPRVTRVGRILRKHSLDEFPQMLNVLLGNMSLVGPRPHLPEEVAQYQDGDYLRLECIPGIVCLPQLAGRDTLGFKEWVELDLEYRRSWSLVLDLRIIVRTARLVLASFLRPFAARPRESFKSIHG
jgi:exopolysaccharide biosynthesis polyprenyl glycosylphosphotransferase